MSTWNITDKQQISELKDLMKRTASNLGKNIAKVVHKNEGFWLYQSGNTTPIFIPDNVFLNPFVVAGRNFSTAERIEAFL